MSEEHKIAIFGSDVARKELQDRFCKRGMACEEGSLKGFSAEVIGATAVLWVGYKMIKQLTPILFAYKRSRKGISITVMIGLKQDNLHQARVETEQDFEKAAKEGIDEIHICEDEHSSDD